MKLMSDTDIFGQVIIVINGNKVIKHNETSLVKQ